jgi:hypothetical protein
MYDQWSRLPTSSNDELAYAQNSSPVLATVFAILSACCAAIAARQFLTGGIAEWKAIVALLAFGLAFGMAALKAATVLETRFRRSPSQMAVVRILFGWERERTHDLRESGSVTCRRGPDPEHDSDTLSYLIEIPTAGESPILVYSYHNHDSAADIGREIAGFFDWSFEDRSLADVEAITLDKYLGTRVGLASIIVVGGKLASLGAAVTAGLSLVTGIAFLAGLCDGWMAISWGILAVGFVAFRLLFFVAARFVAPTDPQQES